MWGHIRRGRTFGGGATFVVVGIVMALGLAVAPAHAEPAVTSGTAATSGTVGPDVSSWQHVDGTGIDWNRVKASGTDFAMVKGTEGLDYVNPFFVADCVAMRLANVARGVYHFADPSLSPEAQGAFYSALVLGSSGFGDMPPVLDLEKTGGLKAPALIDWTHRYLDTVQALTGRAPIIYTGPNFWRTAMANSTEFTRYPLWIADYNGKDAPGPLPGGWDNWTFWQHTDRGNVPGISGGTDMNVYSGARGPFAAFANS